jgi:GT2 family glycosyltransferase
MSAAPSISIVIITYNRPGDMLALAENISQLEYKALLKEVIIVNNKSTESYESVESFVANHPEVPFQYILAEQNLGVSAGRNYAIKQSTGSILVFLDDDAIFQNIDCLLQVHNIFSEPAPGRTIGIAAFKVYYYDTMEMQKTEFPHKQFEEKKQLPHFDTYYYAGCAHAIRREVFDKVGYYPKEFFYGMEEYDLSYRVLDAGYKIVYDDRVVVLHKESPTGRLTNKEKLRGMWVNKSTVAWKYLPGKFFYTTSFLWSLEYLKKTKGDIGGWLKGWQQVRSIPGRFTSNKLKNETLDYLSKVEARLTY